MRLETVDLLFKEPKFWRTLGVALRTQKNSAQCPVHFLNFTETRI